MIWGKGVFKDHSWKKWFAWHPVRLNRGTRVMSRDKGITEYARNPDYMRWVWLQPIYRQFSQTDLIQGYVYQVLPDCDHPDFRPAENDILKKML